VIVSILLAWLIAAVLVGVYPWRAQGVTFVTALASVIALRLIALLSLVV
jgi:hypothetical protein